MIRNYWYLVALSVVIAIITIQTEQFYVFILFFGWLIVSYIQKKTSLFVLFISFIAFCFFYIYIPATSDIQTTNPYIEQQTTFQGQIKSSVKETSKKVEFTFRDSSTQLDVLAVYFIDDTPPHASHIISGGTCTLHGEIVKPDAATNPHQFDYQTYLLQQGINYQLIIHSLDEITCEGYSLLDSIYSMRTTLLQSTLNNINDTTVSWLHALVLGDDSLIDEDVIDIFQRWSLSHILAISGLHIGIVVALLYVILVRTGLFTKENAQWVVICFLPVYALIAGGQPSVLRASLMVLGVIVLNKLNWKLNYTDVISIVFLSLILYDKYIVYHIGFQLSFAVTFGLIISQTWISQTASNTMKVLQISFIAQMIILPLQLYYFHIFQPLSILVNLFVVPYFSIFVIPALFILMLVHWLPSFIISAFGSIFIFIHKHMLQFIQWIDRYLDYPFVIGEISLYMTIIYYVVLVLLMKALESKKLHSAFQYGLCMTGLIIALVIRPYFSPVGSVTMLDIGQGDAFVIELPYREGVFFIDMGTPATFPSFEGTDRAYNQVIKPYLLGEGITKIDTVFLSHEHVDHFGSLRYALEDFLVDEIIISPFYELDEVNEAIWNKHNIPIYRMGFNETIERKDHAFQALSPKENKYDPNENSLVLLTELGELDWIFMGDAEQEAEKSIEQTYPNLQVDVLKVGHHGSNTSTNKSLLQQMNPSYALISAGRNNTYGHPTSETITTLEEAGVHIYRTDEDGAVQYFFTKEDSYFKRFIQR